MHIYSKFYLKMSVLLTLGGDVMEWWYEGDGYGIVGWSFECKHCKRINRFAFSPDTEMNCRYCGKENKFTVEEVERIDRTL